MLDLYCLAIYNPPIAPFIGPDLIGRIQLQIWLDTGYIDWHCYYKERACDNTMPGPISRVFWQPAFCQGLTGGGVTRAGNVCGPDSIDWWLSQAVRLDGLIRGDMLTKAAHIRCGISAESINTNYSGPENMEVRAFEWYAVEKRLCFINNNSPKKATANHIYLSYL